MSKPTISTLERRLRQAHRRTITQSILNCLMIGWIFALAISAIWFVVQPLVVEAPASWLRWSVLGGSLAFFTLLGGWLGYRRSPSRQEVALLLDDRFQLAERVTTTLNLSESERQSSAGQALVADAERKLEKVEVAPRFPVRLRWTAFLVPLEVAGIVLLMLFPFSFLSNSEVEAKQEELKKLAQTKKELDKTGQPIAKKPFIKPADRPGKSEELKQLEIDLEKLLNQPLPDDLKPEMAREKIQKIDSLTDRMKKFEKEQLDKFANMQQQMKALDKMQQGEMKAGPGKEMQDSMKKGDIQEAKKDIDKLRKKLKNNELSQEDKQQLADQMQDLEEKLQRLARASEDEQKLKDLIKQAKEAGRDADSLERELANLQEEMKQNADLRKMADKLNSAREAMKKGDIDKAADELQQLADQLGDFDEKLQDIEDVKEYLQRLKDARKGACKECEGDGECDANGEPKWKKNAKGKGRGMGERPENPNAETDSEDQRVRAEYNPGGKKMYAGSTDGPAFKKQSTMELQGQIQQAAQEAPEAVEVQRLPKASRDLVREYFERLGDQATPKKK